MSGQIGHYTTSYTYLHYSTSAITAQSEFASTNKLCDIASYPALGTAPETHERGTLSTNTMGYVPAMIKQETMAFTAQYDVAQYAALRSFEGTILYFQCGFGENGEYGVWQWHGSYALGVGEGDVDGVRGVITITFYPDENGITPILPSTVSSKTITIAGMGDVGLTGQVKYGSTSASTSHKDFSANGTVTIDETNYVEVLFNLGEQTADNADSVRLKSMSAICDGWEVADRDGGGFKVIINNLKNSPTITVAYTTIEE